MPFNRNLIPLVPVCVRMLARISLFAVVITTALLVDDGSTATTDASSANNYSVAQEPARCPAVPPTDPKECGGGPCIVDIKESGNLQTNPDAFKTLKSALKRPNTTIRIGADVELDFNGLGNKYFPLLIARCVTLMSVDSFEPGGTNRIAGKPVRPLAVKPQSSNQTRPATKPQSTTRRAARSRRNVAQRRRARRNVAQRRSGTRATPNANSNAARIVGGNTGPIDDLEVERPRLARLAHRSRQVPSFGSDQIIQ